MLGHVALSYAPAHRSNPPCLTTKILRQCSGTQDSYLNVIPAPEPESIKTSPNYIQNSAARYN
jgi:hypothetical protein